MAMGGHFDNDRGRIVPPRVFDGFANEELGVALDQELTRAGEDPAQIFTRAPHRPTELKHRARLIHPHPERLESLDRVPEGHDRVGGFLREESVDVMQARLRERGPASREDLPDVDSHRVLLSLRYGWF